MVNIHDVETNHNDWKGERLEAIFTRQKELMDKYHHIEKSNGLLITEDCPVDLNDRFGQARLKDFAWRMTEELGEAMEAFIEFINCREGNLDHCFEEIADALHFLTEMSILAGMTANDVINEEDKDFGDRLRHLFVISGGVEQYEDQIEVSVCMSYVVTELALACNCLKNKPWKQTHMITDGSKFYFHMVGVWHRFITLCVKLGMDDKQLTKLYFGKSEVNKFRQRSNY